MGAHTITRVEFGKTAEEAQEKVWDHDRDYYGHQEGYSGAMNAKRKGYVKEIDPADYKGRNRRKVVGEILGREGDLGEKYAVIDSKMGPTGAISLKGTKEGKKYRKRKGLEGKHGDVWLLFGWARS